MASLAEPLQGGPYPHPDDDADIPNDLKSIVDWTAGRSVMRFTSTSDRDLKLPSPTEGQLCVTNVGTALQVWVYKNSAWREMWVEGSADYDTGWVLVTCRSSFTTHSSYPLKARRQGNRVRLRGGTTAAGMSGAGTFVVADLPAGFAPQADVFGYLWSNTLNPGQVRITTAGEVSFQRPTASSSSFLVGEACEWMIDS